MKTLKRALSVFLIIALLACYAVPVVGADTTTEPVASYVELKLEIGTWKSSTFSPLEENDVLMPEEEFWVRLSVSGNTEEQNINLIQSLISYDETLVESTTAKKANNDLGTIESSVANGKCTFIWMNSDGLCIEDDEGEKVRQDSAWLIRWKFKTKSVTSVSELSFSFLTEAFTDETGNKKEVLVQTGSTLLSYKTVDATATIVVPNSIVISGDDEVHIPGDYDNDMFSVTLNTTGGYSATYYGTDGADSSEEITWSLDAATSTEYFSIEATTLKIKKTTPAGAKCTLMASKTGTDDTTVTATKTITITKDASVPTSYTLTVKQGDTTKATVNGDWSAEVTDSSNPIIGGSSRVVELESPVATATDAERTYTFDLEVKDQYGVVMPDFFGFFTAYGSGLEVDNNNCTLTIPVGFTTVYAGTDGICDFTILSSMYQTASDGQYGVKVKYKVTKAPLVATTVEIEPASATIVIPTGDAAAHQEFTATVKDQYGALMTDRTVTWSLSHTDSNVAGAAGTTDNTYTVHVSKDAQVTTTPITLTATVDSATGVTNSTDITLAKLTFPEMKDIGESVVYGQTYDTLFDVRFAHDNNTGEYPVNTPTEITAALGTDKIKGVYKLYVKNANHQFYGDEVNNTHSLRPNVGTWAYEIRFFSNNDTYQNVVVKSGTYTVTAKPITVTGITANEKVYDGTNSVTLDLSNAELSGVLADDAVTFDQAQNDYTATAENVNAGENKTVNITGLTLSGTSAGNYTLTQPTDVKVKITPKDMTNASWGIQICVGKSAIYNGTTQWKPTYVMVQDMSVTTSVTLEQSTDYNVEYYRGETKLTSDNDFINAGTITMKINFCGNYTGTKTYSYTIAKAEQADLSISVGTNATSMSYGDSLPLNVAGGSGTGAVTCEITDGSQYATLTKTDDGYTIKATGVGSVTVKATKAADGNYNEKVTTQTITVNKHAAVTLDAIPVNLLYTNTSDQTFSASTIAGLLQELDNNIGATATITNVSVEDNQILSAILVKEADGSKITYSLRSGLGKNDATKNATITINYESNNYADGTITLTVTVVDKNQATVTFGEAESKTYTGSAQKPTAPTVTLTSGTADTGKISYTVKKDGSDFAAGFEGMVDAGTYTITATYEDDSNYGTASTTFTISPAELTVSGGTATKVYDGDPQATDITDETLSCTTVTNTDLRKGTDYTISNVAFDNANAGTGKNVTYKVQLNDTDKAKNYTLKAATEGVLTVTTTGTITPKAVTVTVNAIDDQSYNHGAAIEPAVSVTATGLVGSDTLTAGTDYTVSYSSNTTVGTAAVTIGYVTGSNYTVTGTGSFKIKAYVVALPTVKTEALTFNGEVQTGIDASKDSAYYTITGDTATNAGTHTATVTLKDQNNYVWDVTPAAAENQTINWSIAQASAPNSLKNVEKSYKYSLTGAQTAQISGVPNNAGTDQYSVPTDFASEYVKDVSVSESGLVSFTLIGQSEYNEEAETEIPVEVTMTNYVTTTVKVVITFTDKETPTVTVQNITKTYDGKTLTNSDIKGTASVAGSWQFVESTDSMINADTYEDVAVKFVPTDAVNYSEVEKTITVTINKATPTITVETETEDGKLVVKADKDAETFGEVLTSANFGVSGTLTWSGKDSDGNAVAITGDTKLEDVDLDSVTWTFNPTDTTNYEPVTGGISQETSSNWWIIGAIAGGSGKSSPLDDFTDLDKDAWYAEAVEYCLDEGLMSGTGNGKFSPNGGMTRAMVWTVLGRLSGQSFNGTGANWYADAQKWAVRAGISDGTNPNGQITREELVTMLWRFAGSPKADVSALRWYGDSATISDWAREAMAWAASCSLVEGSNWNLTPGAVATRCQVAAIFMRYHKN